MYPAYFIRLRVGINTFVSQIRTKSTVDRSTSLIYKYFFQKNLLLTNSVTSGLFMGLGDLMQQEIECQYGVPLRYDWLRAGRMLIVGMCMGPLHHYYYLHLDKLMPRLDLKSAFFKIFCDQTIASPATLLFFFFGMGILEKKSFKQITTELQNKFLYVYLGDCLYWPPIQFINFYFLPTEYRVFYINAATMIFNIFLSFMKHSYGHEK